MQSNLLIVVIIIGGNQEGAKPQPPKKCEVQVLAPLTLKIVK
jgi:hypothetical protein